MSCPAIKVDAMAVQQGGNPRGDSRTIEDHFALECFSNSVYRHFFRKVVKMFGTNENYSFGPFVGMVWLDRVS